MYKWTGERYEQVRDIHETNHKAAYDSRLGSDLISDFNYYFEVAGKWLVNCRHYSNRDRADAVAYKLSGRSELIHEIQKTTKYWVYTKYK